MTAADGARGTPVTEAAHGARGTRVLRLPRPVLVAGLLAGVATASGIALTTTSGWLVVRASQGPQIMSLLTVIVAVRTFGVARPTFRYLERLRSHDHALGELAGRRAETYARLVPLTPARLGRRGRSDLLSGVVDDLTDVTEASVRVSIPVIGALVAAVLATALTTLVSPVAGAVLAAMLGVTALLVLLCWRLESTSQDELVAARAEVARVGQLSTEHAAELRAIGAADQVLGDLRRAHAGLRTAIARQSRGRALVAGGLLLLTGAATVVTALAVHDDGHSLPVQGLLVLVPVAVGEAAGVLTDAVRALARAQAAAGRLDGLLEQTPAVQEVGTDGPDGLARPAVGGRAPELRLEQVSASWRPGARHLAPLDLTLRPGEKLALTGRNGSGKSTALAVLARHLDPDGGRYLVDGADATRLPLATVRDLVAVVDDEPHVFATTLRENLRLAAPPEAGDDDLVAALVGAGLGSWFADLDDGLDTRLGTGGAGVSGGERSRLAIARALASGRPVILLDEPVAHLDAPTAEGVIDDLVTHSPDRSVMMVTHHRTGLARMDRVLDLEEERAG